MTSNWLASLGKIKNKFICQLLILYFNISSILMTSNFALFEFISLPVMKHEFIPISNIFDNENETLERTILSLHSLA